MHAWAWPKHVNHALRLAPEILQSQYSYTETIGQSIASSLL